MEEVGSESRTRAIVGSAAAVLAIEHGADLVIMGEREIAVGMSDFALQRLGVGARDARNTVDRLRGSGSGSEKASKRAPSSRG